MRNGILCVLLVGLCVLAIHPVLDAACGDDFSYVKTALDFERTGKFVYNGWAAPISGWLIPWGALFVKLFGFSFDILRISIFPIAAATIVLFHQILRRFGINSQNAVFGTLAVGLSPIFLFPATMYQTDVPGLFVTLLCIYMCQRAVAAQTDRRALAWLISAALVNIGGGTVRQTAWLGVLVIVPSTAWLLRKRRGAILTGTLMWLFGVVAILACLHWFNQQPYSLREQIVPWPVGPRDLRHMTYQMTKTFLCLILVILPVSIAWITTARRLSRSAKWRFALAILLSILVAVHFYKAGTADTWAEPWLIPTLDYTAFGVAPLWVRAVISFLVVTLAVLLAEQLVQESSGSGDTDQPSGWGHVAWILGPFTLSYLLLLVPRATLQMVQDRYLLGIAPFAIIVLLKLYQERVNRTLPVVSFIVLVVIAVISVGYVHDFFAASRALTNVVATVEKSGIPRDDLQAGTDIESGWAQDGWVQIEEGGHINDAHIKVPVGAYKPYVPDARIPPECQNYLASRMPAIHPEYFVVRKPKSCFAPTTFPVIHYKTWFPPFHRAIYVEKLTNIAAR